MRVLAVLAVLAGLGAASAEEAPAPLPAPAPEAPIDEGFSLLEEGAKLILRGLFDEMGPALEEAQKGLAEAGERLGPALAQLGALIDDVQNYEAPERLPNGDIVIRRKPGAPAPPPLPEREGAPKAGAPATPGEVEL